MIDFEALAIEERPQASRIAEWMAAQHSGLSVLDVGCGPGLYVDEMRARGVEAFGIDNDPRLVEAEHLWCADLLKMPSADHFDIVMSLEVGEHLFESQSRPFVRVLAEHAQDFIYFSAAQPGQGGAGHYNCQPKGYWVERFAELGWKLDQERTDVWLGWMKNGPHMGWLINNGMVFGR